MALPAAFGTSDLSLKLIEKLDLLNELALKEGIDFSTHRTSGVRSFYRQSQMYAAYKANPVLARQRFGIVALPAAPGLSLHHGWDHGLSYAVDIALPQRETTEGQRRQARLGKLAEGVGLQWGGRFKSPDPVHFSFPFDIFVANQSLMSRVDTLMSQGEIEI